jgi:hypothetical protein
VTVPRLATLASRYRIAVLALLVSAALHAAVFVSLPPRIGTPEDDEVASYSAALDPAAIVVTTQGAAPPPAPARPRAARPRSPHPKSRIAPPRPPPPAIVPEPLAPVDHVALAPLAAEPVLPPEPPPPPEPPQMLALAQPAVPVKALEPGKFPVQALPASMSIDYKLTSAFADGRASYHWEREGDSYRISAEAEAEGFFTLFLEGRILQESRGTVTSAGLRPESFSERKPGGPPEGLEFDWPGKQVTFDRNGEKKVSPLTGNTVDWLSMIFQLAHVPPSTGTFDLQVFTQRRMYRFSLKVLGVEEIDIPIGHVRALHLRHADPANAREVVDVWLGVDQHYLPVKLRFPAARNRIMVEQVATRVSAEGEP